MSRRTKLWIISIALGLSVTFTHAQSSVTVKLETKNGHEVQGVQVSAQHLATDNRVIEVLKLKEIEKKGFRTDQLTKGQYVVIVCDAGLKYEPDRSLEFNLGDREPKKLQTMVLEDKSVPQPISDKKKGDKVCVIHRTTDCRALTSVDGGGNIVIPGKWEDYKFEAPESCK